MPTLAVLSYIVAPNNYINEWRLYVYRLLLLYISPKNKPVKQNVDANPTRSQHRSHPTPPTKDNEYPLKNRDLIIIK